jgi:hypothetical protein
MLIRLLEAVCFIVRRFSLYKGSGTRLRVDSLGHSEQIVEVIYRGGIDKKARASSGQHQSQIAALTFGFSS